MALRISGSLVIPQTPHAPIALNHAIMIGPNRRPTAAVPKRWAEKSAKMITAVIGTTQLSSDGLMTLTPSTAERTEMAGVIMLSPRKRAAPKSPNAANTALVRALASDD